MKSNFGTSNANMAMICLVPEIQGEPQEVARDKATRAFAEVLNSDLKAISSYV
jgi:hypothetical protein